MKNLVFLVTALMVVVLVLYQDPSSVEAQSTHWVDAAATSAAPGTGCGTDAGYTTIAAAIAAAVAGDTVEVCAGTYAEGPQIVIDKNLTIVGEDRATTIVIPTANTSGSSGDASSWFLITSGATVNISNLTFDGAGFLIGQAIRFNGAQGTIQNIQVQNIATGSYLGIGVVALFADVDVFGSGFANIARIGVSYFGAGTIGTFDGNVYTGEGPGDFLDYGVEVSAGANAIIINSTFTDNLGEASDGSTSAGILVTTAFGGGTSAQIEGNDFSNNRTAILVGFGETDTSSVNAHQNNISGNANGVTSTAPQVFATCNWWGDVSGPSGEGPGTGDSVSENVTYEPWLTAPAPGGSCDGPRDEATPTATATQSPAATATSVPTATATQEAAATATQAAAATAIQAAAATATASRSRPNLGGLFGPLPRATSPVSDGPPATATATGVTPILPPSTGDAGLK